MNHLGCYSLVAIVSVEQMDVLFEMFDQLPSLLTLDVCREIWPERHMQSQRDWRLPLDKPPVAYHHMFEKWVVSLRDPRPGFAFACRLDVNNVQRLFSWWIDHRVSQKSQQSADAVDARSIDGHCLLSMIDLSKSFHSSNLLLPDDPDWQNLSWKEKEEFLDEHRQYD